jgi:hypothetical protein
MDRVQANGSNLIRSSAFCRVCMGTPALVAGAMKHVAFFRRLLENLWQETA